jgi:NitT/TauT family transport system permease protein
MKYPKKKNIAYNILGVISIITAWQLGAYFTGNVDIFPSPIKSFITLTRITATENFWIHIGTTLFRGILGGILSLILGFVLGFLSSINAPLRGFIMPWVILLRSVPVISVILLAVIWLAPGYVPFFIMMITITPIIVEEVSEGIVEINGRYKEMITIYKVSLQKQLTHVILPGLLPRIASGFSLGMGYGWRAVVVGEVLSRPQWGIGDRMAHSQNYFNADELIAWTVVLIIISYFFDKLIETIKNRIIKWQ